MQVAYVVMSVFSLVSIALAAYFDKKRRGGILDKVDPLAAFERYTEKKIIVRESQR